MISQVTQDLASTRHHTIIATSVLWKKKKAVASYSENVESQRWWAIYLFNVAGTTHVHFKWHNLLCGGVTNVYTAKYHGNQFVQPAHKHNVQPAKSAGSYVLLSQLEVFTWNHPFVLSLESVHNLMCSARQFAKEAQQKKISRAIDVHLQDDSTSIQVNHIWYKCVTCRSRDIELPGNAGE